MTSQPLEAYPATHSAQGRKDVSDDRLSLYLVDQLSPARYPTGCWPSEKDLGLVHSQQLAVNQIVGEMSDSAGIKSVNGPPGTGKTTLLRDIVAALITGREDTLASFKRAADAFVRDGREIAEQAKEGGKNQYCFTLNEQLFGHEMVVALARPRRSSRLSPRQRVESENLSCRQCSPCGENRIRHEQPMAYRLCSSEVKPAIRNFAHDSQAWMILPLSIV